VAIANILFKKLSLLIKQQHASDWCLIFSFILFFSSSS